MSISSFIQKTKSSVLNKVEARKNAVYSERLKKAEEYKVKNAVLREEMKAKADYQKAKAENRKLRVEKLTGNLPSFGGMGSSSNKKGKKVNTGFGSPFAGGIGGNSPFKPSNLSKDSFGKGSSATGLKLGGNSPFSNAFASAPQKKAKKKMKGKTIIKV